VKWRERERERERKPRQFGKYVNLTVSRLFYSILSFKTLLIVPMLRVEIL